MLTCSGHDFHDLLDRYTMEQLEVLAGCAWQHKITQMNVIAYALGGGEAAGRMPGENREPEVPEGPSIGWEAAKGENRLAKRLADGTIVPIRPKITPEQDERNKLRALSQLLGVQAATAQLVGKVPDRLLPGARPLGVEAADLAPVAAPPLISPEAAMQSIRDQLLGAPTPKRRR